MPPAVRLGELLVDSGIISREQLSDALQHQRSHGGRLGTCLVELGFVDDKTLTATLAKQLSIPSTTASQLEKCDAFAVKLVPPPMAERLRCVPIRQDGDKLWVAMADPTDRQALGELSKHTGKQVRPMVAPELLLQYALEKYYKVKRKPRVVQVQTSASDLLKIDAKVGAVPLAGMASPPRATTPASGIASPSPPPDASSDAPIYTGFGSGPIKVDIDAVAGFLDEQRPQEPAAPPRIPMDKVSSMLVAAQTDDAIFDVAMRYVAQDVGRLAVFLLRNGLLGGWRGNGVDSALLRQVNVGLEESPIVAKVLSQPDAWVGRLYAAELGALAAPLGAAREGLGVILPVRIGKRAVGVIIGLDGSLNSLRNKPELDRLAIKLDQALHISYLRRLLLQP
jgi:type II secretion system (T2SS) protein E